MIEVWMFRVLEANFLGGFKKKVTSPPKKVPSIFITWGDLKARKPFKNEALPWSCSLATWVGHDGSDLGCTGLHGGVVGQFWLFGLLGKKSREYIPDDPCMVKINQMYRYTGIPFMDDMVVEDWSESLLFLYISLLWPGHTNVHPTVYPLLGEMIQFDKYVWREDPYECNLLNECVSISFAVANSCQSVNCVSRRIIQQGLMSFSGVLHLFAHSHVLPPIPTLPVKTKGYPTSYDSYEKDPDLPHRILMRWHVICYESFVCFGLF